MIICVNIIGFMFVISSLVLTCINMMHLLFIMPDLECIFTVICDLVSKSGSPDEALEMAKLICGKIIQQPTDKPALRLKM